MQEKSPDDKSYTVLRRWTREDLRKEFKTNIKNSKLVRRLINALNWSIKEKIFMEPNIIGNARIWIRGKKEKHIVFFRIDGQVYFNLTKKHYPGGDAEWKRFYNELEENGLVFHRRIPEITQGSELEKHLEDMTKEEYEKLLRIIRSYSFVVPHIDTFEMLSADLAEINKRNIPNTEKKELVNARVGQGLFREKLSTYWGRCCISGYTNTNLLIASHIKPWHLSSDSERLDLYNGLLLLPNYDLLFDKGLISFSDEGDLLISRTLRANDMKHFGIKKGKRIDFSKKHLEYIQYHREWLFLA